VTVTVVQSRWPSSGSAITFVVLAGTLSTGFAPSHTARAAESERHRRVLSGCPATVRRMGWQRVPAAEVIAHLFFLRVAGPASSGSTPKQKRICSDCPLSQCRDHAVGTPDCGVWGAMTSRERAKLYPSPTTGYVCSPPGKAARAGRVMLSGAEPSAPNLDVGRCSGFVPTLLQLDTVV
jgi:hypothetical protein